MQMAQMMPGLAAGGPAGRGNDSSNEAGATGHPAGDDAAGNRPAGDAATGDRAAGEPPAGRRGSLASVLETLRDAASAHDDQTRAPVLPATGPLPDKSEDD
jgi:hypothetical protein